MGRKMAKFISERAKDEANNRTIFCFRLLLRCFLHRCRLVSCAASCVSSRVAGSRCRHRPRSRLRAISWVRFIVDPMFPSSFPIRIQGKLFPTPTLADPRSIDKHFDPRASIAHAVITPLGIEIFRRDETVSKPTRREFQTHFPRSSGRGSVFVREGTLEISREDQRRGD